MQESITIDFTQCGIVNCVFFFQSLTSCIYFAEDITTENIDKCLIVVCGIACNRTVCLVERRDTFRSRVIVWFSVHTDIGDIAATINITEDACVIANLNFCST